jgi:hypothetical protein
LQQLDANKNNVIDRQETRELRLLFKRSQKLRRCSKKLPAFCDTNADKRITADEWLHCLGVVKGIYYTPDLYKMRIYQLVFFIPFQLKLAILLLPLFRLADLLAASGEDRIH